MDNARELALMAIVEFVAKGNPKAADTIASMLHELEQKLDSSRTWPSAKEHEIDKESVLAQLRVVSQLPIERLIFISLSGNPPAALSEDPLPRLWFRLLENLEEIYDEMFDEQSAMTSGEFASAYYRETMGFAANMGVSFLGKAFAHSKVRMEPWGAVIGRVDSTIFCLTQALAAAGYLGATKRIEKLGRSSSSFPKRSRSATRTASPTCWWRRPNNRVRDWRTTPHLSDPLLDRLGAVVFFIIRGSIQ